MNKSKRGLGRGLQNYFGDTTANEKVRNNEKNSIKVEDKEKKEIENNKDKGEIFVKLSLIEPNKNQPRKDFNAESLEELTNSIKEFGILQPLLVRSIGKKYEIIAGERRFRAAHSAGLKQVPVLVRDYDERKSKEVSIIENIQRDDLNPIEEARAYQSLINEYGVRQEDIAERMSKNRSTITNSLRLLKLDEYIQDFIAEGKISSGHARALLSIEDKEIQKELVKEIISRNLSVRETERLVKSLQKKPKKEKVNEERDYFIFFKNYEEKIREILNTKVNVNMKDRNKGRIEIEYYSYEEFERIAELLDSIKR